MTRAMRAMRGMERMRTFSNTLMHDFDEDENDVQAALNFN